ncbi:energy-coupling factor ABC transporter substrate-binding protein [Heliobacterium chlorum]|uniref:Cobalt transport protein CbiN n=1 Tax=Heliobacterium chlorum TaxID=2698 RepID=A0ABR7T0A3_HELCL|nr:energy-coupling factor ABC transporter substrate-binding protein [Heliobacterium chlorum]MBC9783705.1 energy-coupling factor ABC transporter substrate-binding protein [Heliobacterium chlorum]
MSKFSIRNNILLIAAAVLLSALPLFMSHHFSEGNAAFSGTDDQAEAAIQEINPDYKPWFQSFWEPPSSEIESLLFALQATLGAGFIGYYIGQKRKRSNPLDTKLGKEPSVQ